MRYLWKYLLCVVDALCIAFNVQQLSLSVSPFDKVWFWFVLWTVVIGVFFLDSLIEGIRLHVKYLAKQEKEEAAKHA